ncbi:hypothetical protein Bca52824_026388 [Brassica carinata]|uniref:Uncharacterized protein n=1 Tax=Brassica carinata TaxID=52824 RepID=A0A8X7SJM4_BRACI|nr:hypothetical protein Bca52824_026388 [Brassica carinata]
MTLQQREPHKAITAALKALKLLGSARKYEWSGYLAVVEIVKKVGLKLLFAWIGLPDKVKIMLGLRPERKLKYPIHQHEIKLSGGGSEVSLCGNLLLLHQWHNRRSQPPELQLGSTSTALMVMTGTEAIT